MASYDTTEVAVLLTTCNKYTPGEQVFRLQRLVGLKENSAEIQTVQLSTDNIMNADTSTLPISSVNNSATIKLSVPMEIARRYPTKFIPPGTRFIVAFESGDISKPIIVGGEF